MFQLNSDLMKFDDMGSLNNMELFNNIEEVDIELLPKEDQEAQEVIKDLQKDKERYQVPLLRHQKLFRNKVINEKIKNNLLCTGLGGGKTFTAGIIVLELTNRYPGCPGLIYAPIGKVLDDSTIAGMGEYFNLMNADHKIITHNHSRYLWLEGTLHYLRTMDRPEGIRGVQCSWTYGDEICHGKNIAFKNSLVRARLPRGPRVNFFTTTPNGHDFVYDFFVKEPLNDPSLTKERFYIAGVDSSNNKFLSADYVKSLNDDLGGKFKQQEKGGKFVNMQGNIFNPKKINIAFNPSKPFDLAIDFGLRRPAVLFMQEFEIMFKYEMNYKKVDVVVESILPENVTIHNLVDMIYEKIESYCRPGQKVPSPTRIYCDPAGDSGNSQTLISDIQVIKNVFKSTTFDYSYSAIYRNIEHGIIAMLTRFDRGLVYISKYLSETLPGEYTNVFDAVSNISYQEIKNGKYNKNVYEKDFILDHPVDAFRYWAINKYPPISYLKKFDRSSYTKGGN